MMGGFMAQVTTKRVGYAGAILLALVLVLRYGAVSKVISNEILKRIRLEPGTQLWDMWTDLPIPVYTKFYFFNVTNPGQVINGGKPILKEMGPYVYEEKRMKIILSENEDEIKYRPRTTWFFRKDLSYGAESDRVTLLNIPFLGISRMAWDMSKEPYVLSTLDEMLSEKGEQVFQINTVKELLFDGYSIENYMEMLSLPIKEVFGKSVKVPERLLDGDFGFYDDRNGTADDVWVVKTGRTNPADFGRVVSWNGKPDMDVWKDEKCDKLKGTDGSLFPPFTNPTHSLDVFVPELCRSVKMVYTGQKRHYGIDTMRFGFAPSVFGSLKDYPENACYCKETFEYCTMGGVVPIGACVGGAPLFISRPHLSKAHPNFTRPLIGLEPMTEGYDSYIDLEVNTGVVLRANFKLQMNVELQAYNSMPTFANVPSILFPLMWLEQSAAIPEDFLLSFKIFGKTIRGINLITDALLGVSLLCIVGAILWEGKKCKWCFK